MERTYQLDANTCSIRPSYIKGIEIVLSDASFDYYVKWYKEFDGCVPDFFDSPLWYSYMDEFNEAVNYIECDVDYPDGFLDDLEKASREGN